MEWAITVILRPLYRWGKKYQGGSKNWSGRFEEEKNLFLVPPPGCGRSVTDFWVWGANRAQLRCPDDVSDDIYERGVPGKGLKPKFYKLPRP
jgi:hypothetical protein